MGRKLDNAIALYLEGIRDGNAREAVTKYTGDRYTQHSTGVKDGIDGFVEFFTDFLARNPERDIQVVRGWEDGRYVFLHVLQSLNGGETRWVTTDFFDTDDNDRIIEHWDVISAFAPRTPAGHTSVDGATAITDVDMTDENKALVRAMIEDLLMPGGDPANATRYIAPDYIQHNAEVADGIDAFARHIGAPDRPLWYHDIVLLVGRGNFVATLCQTTRANQEFAQVDIYRIEDGLIVEHWDNAEPVPPRDEWVNTGKF